MVNSKKIKSQLFLVFMFVTIQSFSQTYNPLPYSGYEYSSFGSVNQGDCYVSLDISVAYGGSNVWLYKDVYLSGFAPMDYVVTLYQVVSSSYIYGDNPLITQYDTNPSCSTYGMPCYNPSHLGLITDWASTFSFSMSHSQKIKITYNAPGVSSTSTYVVSGTFSFSNYKGQLF